MKTKYQDNFIQAEKDIKKAKNLTIEQLQEDNIDLIGAYDDLMLYGSLLFQKDNLAILSK